MKIYYNPILKKFSRELRNHSTRGEIILWQHLKARKIYGYQFMRQKPIGQYIVDFYCSRLRLAIEIDGMSHACTQEADAKRQCELEKLGIRFLRFYEGDVIQHSSTVVATIKRWIMQHGKTETMHA